MTDEQQEQPSKAKRPPIGGIQQQSRYATIGGKKHTEVQNAGLSDVQNARMPEVEQSESSNKENARMPEVQTLEQPKSKQSKRKQKTVYLSPALAHWLNVQAAQEEREVSEIVEDALKLYRDQVS